MKTEVCAATFLARHGGGEGWLSGDALPSGSEDGVKTIANSVMPTNDGDITPGGAVNSVVAPDIQLP
jgi:hypothetical protein